MEVLRRRFSSTALAPVPIRASSFILDDDDMPHDFSQEYIPPLRTVMSYSNLGDIRHADFNQLPEPTDENARRLVVIIRENDRFSVSKSVQLALSEKMKRDFLYLVVPMKIDKFTENAMRIKPEMKNNVVRQLHDKGESFVAALLVHLEEREITNVYKHIMISKAVSKDLRQFCRQFKVDKVFAEKTEKTANNLRLRTLGTTTTLS
eukprot:c15895_g1_i3.p1 GENE.c15895_g1_i3~~c15895_g1_i3.p1  ORF type:complete len:206 (-),score=48.08 c15895_g1_i3:767-1384(-)